MNLAAGQPRIRNRQQMGDWVRRAACTGLNPELFHPHRGESAAAATAVCATCPVRPECLEFALRSNEPFGIWGGESDRGRRKIRADNPALIAQSECPRCGTLFRPYAGQRFCSVDCRDHHRTTWGRL